jgi:hypothetical protein
MCLVAGILQAQRAPDLDTRFLPVPSPPTPEQGIVAGGQGGPWQGPVPVAVRLLGVEPATCWWDEALTYDVEIRNISRTAIVLPWSVVPPDDPPPSASSNVFLTMSASLRLSDDPRASLGIMKVLYGDLAHPSTVRRVQPGESVLVRFLAACVIHFASVQRAFPPVGSALKVSALVSLRRRDTELPALIRSNEIDITVVRIEEPPRP